jgi:putative ABC transport system ATP-binding protein
MPEAFSGRRIAYASSDTCFFYGTLRGNILYDLKHAHASLTNMRERSDRLQMGDGGGAACRQSRDLSSDWVDYGAPAASGPEDIYRFIRPVLDAALMPQDIFDMALRSTVDIVSHTDMAHRIVELR